MSETEEFEKNESFEETDAMPALKKGFVRLAVLLQDATPMTPGELAQQLGVPLDRLGYIMVTPQQVRLDVEQEHLKAVREKLELLGPIQVEGREEPQWRWMRLEIGRNRGVTMQQLRRHCQRAGLERPGRIHVQNSYSVLGVPEHLWDHMMKYFKAVSVNGQLARPSFCAIGPDGGAEFIPKPQPRPL